MKDFKLFKQELKVLNIGLSSFAENLKSENTKVISLKWSPPASGNKKMMSLMDRLNKLKAKE